MYNYIMSKKIILTSKNYDSINKNFTYVFPFPQDFTDYEMCVSQFNMFNSWFNISSAIGNNTIRIGVPNANGSSYIDIIGTIPDGFYDSYSFNLYLQSLMYDNGLYYSTGIGTVTYFLSLDLLATEYKNSVTLYKVSGFTLQNGTSYSSNRDIYLNVQFSSKLGELYGFTSNLRYGPTSYSSSSSTSKIIIKSNLTPQVNPFNSIIVLCDVVNQLGFANPSDYLYSCALSSAYGSMLQAKKVENVYVKCINRVAKSITLNLVDNYFNKLEVLDNNSMIILTFRKIEKKL